MKKIVLFSVSLMSLAMPTVIHAAEHSGEPVDVEISLRQWIKKPGVGFSTSPIGTYKGKAYPDKYGDYEPVLKPLEGYELIDSKLDKPIKGNVKGGFTITYVACKTGLGSSKLTDSSGSTDIDTLANLAKSQSISGQLPTLPSLTPSEKVLKDQPDDQQSESKAKPTSDSKPVSPQPSISKEQPSDNKKTHSPQASALKETSASQRPLPSKQPTDTKKITNQAKTQSTSDQPTTSAGSVSAEASRQDQAGGQRSEAKIKTGVVDKSASTQASISKERPSDVRKNEPSQKSKVQGSENLQQPVKPIQTVPDEPTSTESKVKPVKSQEQPELSVPRKKLAGREASQPELTKVCGVNENGELLFEKTVARDQLATICRQGSNFYGYDWQRTTYDRTRSCYLLRYQRKTIPVTVIAIDQAGNRLESHQVFGKFGKEVTCQAVPVQGYRPMITSKQIAISTPEPQTVEMLYLKNETQQPVSTRAIDQSLLTNNNASASVPDLKTKVKPIKSTDIHHTKKLKTPLKKKSRHSKKSTRHTGKKRIHQAKKVAASATVSPSKSKVSSNSATPVSQKQSATKQPGQRLPQTGETDSRKGMIVGLGLLLGLLIPIVKKKI